MSSFASRPGINRCLHRGGKAKYLNPQRNQNHIHLPSIFCRSEAVHLSHRCNGYFCYSFHHSLFLIFRNFLEPLWAFLSPKFELSPGSTPRCLYQIINHTIKTARVVLDQNNMHKSKLIDPIKMRDPEC